ncbi:MAG: ribonuclease J [Candidatus Paceibacterota bacterium]|jgi:ribonuclease J
MVTKRNPRQTTHHKSLKDATKEDGLRFIPLGGLEEIGRNMSVFEYDDEIVIFDMGLQFPEDDTPGIDFIIPNVNSLIPKKKNIKAIIITHGHYDHIGAIPYLIDKLGNHMTIYAPALAKEIILKRQADFPNSPKPYFEVIKGGDKIKIGKYFEAEFFETLHTIPDSVSVVLKTPIGNMAYTSDLKVDYTLDGKPLDLEVYENIGKRGIHTLFLESTGADRAGRSVPEELVERNLNDLIANAKGRLIIGLFASLLTRVDTIIRLAEKHNRKVFLSGLSLKNNVQIARNLGHIKTKKELILPIEELHKYKDEKIMVLSTGAQGEPRASLTRIANGEHKQVQIKKGDTLIFSSSVIPGNERPIQILKDNLTRQGARVIQTEHIDVHSSGHGPAEDLKMVTRIIKPRFFIPIHGWYFMRAANTRLAQEVGVAKENCFLVDNGQVVNITKDKVEISKDSVPAYYVMVDGLGVGDVEEIVVRDRLVLAQEGMMVLIITLDRRMGKLLKNPDIISRGFIYLKENKEVVEEVRKKIKNLIGRIPRFQSVESDYLKNMIRDQVGQFVYNKTKRRPMVIPVIIEV